VLSITFSKDSNVYEMI